MPTAGFDPEQHARRLAPIGAVLVIAGGCLGGVPGVLVAVLGVILLLLACFSRDDGLLILGPFVRAELVRAARGKRPWLWRAIYALAAGVILIGNVWVTAEPLLFGRAPNPSLLAAINEKVAIWFALCLFGYVCLLTVQLIAPIVAEEREAKRWDVLLATDLRSREILVGKAVGRLPQILDPVLASLPVLALTPLLGGVSPRLVLAFGVATVAVVAGLSGVAFFYSTFSKTARAAAGRTWFLAIVYIFGTIWLWIGLAFPRFWLFPTSVGLPSPITVSDVVVFLSSGNPICVPLFASTAVSGGTGGFEDRFVEAVGRFAAFHLGVSLIFGLTAAGRLRRAKVWAGPAAKQQAPLEEKPNAELKPKPSIRPPIGEWPVYWWQRYSELKTATIVIVSKPTWRSYAKFVLLCIAIFLASYVLDVIWPWGPNRVTAVVEGLTLFTLWGISLLIMLAPLFRGATTITRERTADTLDSLRLTALEPKEILFQKWLGCSTVELPVFKVLLAFGVAGMLTGYVHPLSLVGLSIVVPVFAGSAAAIGLYFSVLAATPGRAVRNMVLIGMAVLYVLGSVLSSRAFGRSGSEARTAVLIPPMVTGFVVAAGPALRDERRRARFGVGMSRETQRMAIACVVSPLVWGLTGWAAWRGAVRRFAAEKHD